MRFSSQVTQSRSFDSSLYICDEIWPILLLCAMFLLDFPNLLLIEVGIYLLFQSLFIIYCDCKCCTRSSFCVLGEITFHCLVCRDLRFTSQYVSENVSNYFSVSFYLVPWSQTFSSFGAHLHGNECAPFLTVFDSFQRMFHFKFSPFLDVIFPFFFCLPRLRPPWTMPSMIMFFFNTCVYLLNRSPFPPHKTRVLCIRSKFKKLYDTIMRSLYVESCIKRLWKRLRHALLLWLCIVQLMERHFFVMKRDRWR